MNSREYKSAVAAFGCIVCRNTGYGATPAQLHHPFGRKGKLDNVVLPLCYSHHQSGVNTPEFVSRHPWKREWVKRYGSEYELLAQLKAELK